MERHGVFLWRENEGLDPRLFRGLSCLFVFAFSGQGCWFPCPFVRFCFIIRYFVIWLLWYFALLLFSSFFSPFSSFFSGKLSAQCVQFFQLFIFFPLSFTRQMCTLSNTHICQSVTTVLPLPFEKLCTTFPQKKNLPWCNRTVRENT